MSFRLRLTLFFLAIVVVPMVVVAVLVVRVTDDSRAGKVDARLAGGLETAQVLYDEALRGAPGEVERIAEVDRVAPALEAEDEAVLEREAERQVRGSDLAAVSFFAADGARLAAAGPNDGIAAHRAEVRFDSGEVVGAIRVAMLDPDRFAAAVARLTGRDAAVVSRDGVAAATVELGGAALPADTDGVAVTLPGGDARVAALPLDGAPAGTRLVLISPEGEGFVASEPLVGAVLVGFFALALLLIVLLLRALHRQVRSMLEAARRVGSGDFSSRVPVAGNDEMAGLASEFNKMSGRLDEQMGQLRRQREELDQSVRRLGEAFASGLDRSALLEIVLDTAVSACEAETGKVLLLDDDRDEDRADAGADGDGGEGLDPVLAEAGEQALREHETVGRVSGESFAIAHPLTRPGDPSAVLGAMAVARRDRRFDSGEREVLRYLAGQASVSVENVGLHEHVAEQAVTDELTGLSNSRYFRDWMEREIARIQRFGGELSLVILDIDDFKRVNDTRGHLQGDDVLESIGRTLRLESRGIDEAARYGGEEFVLALPETPPAGALEVAERVRERIAATEVAGRDGSPPVRVTASLGIATMPHDAIEAQGLLAVADGALYRAKRNGKNRVEAADGAAGPDPPRAQGKPGRRRT